jgi:DNA-3-methyladenine glycosylase II
MSSMRSSKRPPARLAMSRFTKAERRDRDAGGRWGSVQNGRRTFDVDSRSCFLLPRIRNDREEACKSFAVTRTSEKGWSGCFASIPGSSPIAAEAGSLPLRLREPGFEGLAHIIVSQMVSRASAEAIWRRMLPVEGILTAENYALLHPEAWREFGLSRAKAGTLSRIAEAVVSGGLDLAGLSGKPPAEALAELTALKGVGPWTAEVYLMFCGGHVDVFPSGDVALQNAVAAAFGLSERPRQRRLPCWQRLVAVEIRRRPAFLGLLCT